MPNIKEFEAGDVKLSPTSMGTDAAAGTARRIGTAYKEQASAIETLARATSHLASDTNKLASETAHLGAEKGAALARFGNQLGSSIEMAGAAAVKYLDHQQISQGNAAYSRLTEQTTKAWNDTVKSADPNDPMVAKKFMDGLETTLGEFKDQGFYTENSKKWAEAHVAALRQHMTEKTMGDMASLAGHAARVNQQQTINSLSSTARDDPSSLDFSLAALKSGTEGMIATSPNLTGVQAAAVRSEIMQKGAEAIVKSAALGYIDKTGKMPPWATDPKYAPYIDGNDLKQFEKQAQAQTKANALTERALKKAEREEIEAKANTAISKTWTDNVRYGPDDKAIVNPNVINKLMDIERAYPGAATREIKSMIGVVQKEIDERVETPKAVSAASTNDLLARIRSEGPDRLTTNEEIYKAKIDGRINNTDFKFLQEEFNNARTPEGARLSSRADDFLKAVKPQIDKANMLGRTDPSGAEGFYRLQFDLAKKMSEYRKAGKDPFDLLDPSKPDYMGNPAKLVPYQKTLAESLKDIANKLRSSGGSGFPAQETITGTQTVKQPVATSTPAPPPPKPPEKGFVKDGWEFLGGNAGEAKNWRKVGA